MNELRYQSINDGLNRLDLIVPSSPEMVGVVRLTVSGIASRMGFQIDEIEDIKVAVAEVCNMIINKSTSIPCRFIIIFNMLKDQLKITFRFENRGRNNFKLFDDNDLLGISIINSLIDVVDIESDLDCPNIITLSMFLKENYDVDS